MAIPRTNTPSRRRPSQAIKSVPEPEADTEAEIPAPQAKTSHRRRHNQVTDTKPEAEIENNGTDAPRALAEAEAEAEAKAEAGNQLENPAHATIPTKNPLAPRQWALYFANLVRSPLIPSSSCFPSAWTLPSTHPSPIHSHHNTLTHLI